MKKYETAKSGEEEALTLSVGLSLVFTSVMMIVMPAIIKTTFPVDKQLILGGAWMGGTIKMIHNVLIGVIAFCVAHYFTTRVKTEETGRKVGAIESAEQFRRQRADEVFR